MFYTIEPSIQYSQSTINVICMEFHNGKTPNWLMAAAKPSDPIRNVNCFAI